MAASENFEVRSQRADSSVIIAPRGEIDLATVDLVRAAIARDHEPGDTLVIDLRDVGFMDTSGLRLVLEMNERATAEEFSFRVVRGPTAVQRVFEVSGVARRLPFVDDPAEEPPHGV